jgi:hypothetical protein
MRRRSRIPTPARQRPRAARPRSAANLGTLDAEAFFKVRQGLLCFYRNEPRPEILNNNTSLDPLTDFRNDGRGWTPLRYTISILWSRQGGDPTPRLPHAKLKSAAHLAITPDTLSAAHGRAWSEEPFDIWAGQVTALVELPTLFKKSKKIRPTNLLNHLRSSDHPGSTV